MKIVAITTGDPDGIGLEVTVKALKKIGPKAGVHFLVYRQPALHLFEKKLLKNLDVRFRRREFNTAEEALRWYYSSKVTSKDLIEVVTPSPAPSWVEEACRLATQNRIQGLVTAPLSKELIHSSGMQDNGHTEIFKRLTGVQTVHQAFVGSEFSVVLVTSHIPLKEVSSKLNSENLKTSLETAKELLRFLPNQQRRKKIAVLGLNPHSGENGILGQEELSFISGFCRENNVDGPLPPDAAFLKTNLKKYGVLVCCYHDQGLIPFKLVHGQDSGAQVNIGFPFPRTSVDHGTAKDIFRKNQANPNSMIEALNLCIKMI